MFRRTCFTRVPLMLSTPHTRLRVRRASGFPCALSVLEGHEPDIARAEIAPRERGVTSPPPSCPAKAGHPVFQRRLSSSTDVSGILGRQVKPGDDSWGKGEVEPMRRLPNPPNPHHIWHKYQAGTASAWPGRGNVLIRSLPLPTATNDRPQPV
jgi:hypothetical protein